MKYIGKIFFESNLFYIISSKTKDGEYRVKEYTRNGRYLCHFIYRYSSIATRKFISKSKMDLMIKQYNAPIKPGYYISKNGRLLININTVQTGKEIFCELYRLSSYSHACIRRSSLTRSEFHGYGFKVISKNKFDLITNLSNEL